MAKFEEFLFLGGPADAQRNYVRVSDPGNPPHVVHVAERGSAVSFDNEGAIGDVAVLQAHVYKAVPLLDGNRYRYVYLHASLPAEDALSMMLAGYKPQLVEQEKVRCLG